MRAGGRIVFILVAALACSACEFESGRWLGDHRVVEFDTANFNSSKVMALGSTQALTLGMIDETRAFPTDILVRSEAPEVISARRDANSGVVVLEAHSLGEAEIQVRTRGVLLDSVTLSTAQATRANALIPAHANAGHPILPFDVRAHGDCGSRRCRLFGKGFIDWEVVPEGAVTRVPDFSGRTSLLMANTGWWDQPEFPMVSIVGVDRISGRELFVHEVEIAARVPLDRFSFTARVIPLVEGSAAPAALSLPGEVPSQVLLAFDAVADDFSEGEVPLSRFNYELRVRGDDNVLEVLGMGDDGEPFRSLLVARESGEVTLRFRTPLLREDAELTITVGAPVPGLSGLPDELATPARP